MNALVAAAVAQRAVRLCIAAEPHCDVAPCEAHIAEAARQLAIR